MTLETQHDMATTADQTTDSSDDPDIKPHDNGANDMSENLSHGKDHTANDISAGVSHDHAEMEAFIAQPDSKQSLLTRLKTDLPFRRRYMHTVCVCWGFVVLVC